MEWKTWQVSSFGKINVFRLYLNESREFMLEKKRKVIPCRCTENRNGVRTSGGEWCEESGG